jgi:hypothetical protein
MTRDTLAPETRPHRLCTMAVAVPLLVAAVLAAAVRP